MTSSSHTRLAEILSDIESRCADYKDSPPAEVQRWCKDNWSLGDSPLREVVASGVTLCQLYGMDQTIGYELNKRGTEVSCLLEMFPTEGIAHVKLGVAIFSLRDFSKVVCHEIEQCEIGIHNNNGKAPAIGQETVVDAVPEHDGPVEGYRWRHNGTVTRGTMPPKAWKMVRFLWNKLSRTAEFDELALPVYDSHGHAPSEDAIGSLRKQANSFFVKHDVLLVVSIKQGTVSLDSPIQPVSS